MAGYWRRAFWRFSDFDFFSFCKCAIKDLANIQAYYIDEYASGQDEANIINPLLTRNAMNYRSPILGNLP